MTCQKVQCRKREDRQDLQCHREARHQGNHYHSIALGWCSPKYADMRNVGGRSGGHRETVQ